MPPSNTSSPLSDAASLPNTNTNDDDNIITYGSGPSRSPSPNGRRRRSSQTSSTVRRRPSSNDDSDLSDLSDEEEQEQEELGNDSDGDQEAMDVEEQEPELEVPRSRLPSAGYRNPAGVATKASPEQRYVEFPYPEYYHTDYLRDSVVAETAFESDSDTNSLSPPPPSTGPKTQDLPKVEPAQQGPLLEEEESDLESLTTDSNEDPPQEIEADEGKEENMSESERPDQEEEEEGDGDVTMRAGDLEIEVEGGPEEEQKGEEVVQDTHMDESGKTGDQEAQVDEEAQPEEPVEEEVEEAPRKLDLSELRTELTRQHHPPCQYSRSARTRRTPLHLPRLL
jgi:hypothetical protein